MRYVLDTSVLVDIERGDAVALRGLERCREAELFISTLSVAECLAGARMSDRPDASDAMLDLLRLFAWATVDAEVAQRSAEVSATLMRAGRQPGIVDDTIAATAILYGATLLTRDKQHFSVPELKGKVKTFAELA